MLQVIDLSGLENGVVGRHTLEQLTQLSGHSIRTLKRYFHCYLNEPPVLSVYPSERVNLLIDGTYFSQDLCLILYRDNTVKFTQLYRLTTGEWYEELKEDLENLLALQVQIESITCDGHKALLKACEVSLSSSYSAALCRAGTARQGLLHQRALFAAWLS